MRNHRVLSAMELAELNDDGLSGEEKYRPLAQHENFELRYRNTGRIAKIDFSRVEKSLCSYGLHKLRRRDSVARTANGYFGFSYVTCKNCRTRSYEPLARVKDNISDLEAWKLMPNHS